MRFEIDGQQVFASIGGRKHKQGQEWIIFIHGAGGNHLVWSQQARSFAYGGYNVLALDFPGHGQSSGPAFDNAQAMADWILKVMDKFEILSAHFVSHSLGGLVCLRLGAEHRERVKSVAFIASAMKIAVHGVLIEKSANDPQKAYKMMHSGFFGPIGQLHNNSVPGHSLIGYGLQIMANNQQNALNADLIACVNYEDGETDAANINCPTLCLHAGMDGMVGLKTCRKLGNKLADCTQHIFENCGHMLTAECPREINEHLRQFYKNKFYG